MSSKNVLLDPLAALIGVLAGVGAFLLIPGAAWALLAALGIAVLVYAVAVGVRTLSSAPNRGPRPAVGAAGDAIAPARVRRGSAVEVWLQRGRKALEGMRQMAGACDQPVIKGQLENIVLEAGDSMPVLDELAAQSAVVQSSLHRLSPAALRDQREDLQASLATRDLPPQMNADKQRALDAVAEQEATLDRLRGAQAGLTARMESIVLGLERLSSEMSETVTAAATSAPVAQSGGADHLHDLSDQLSGLQAGLEESRRYTAQILGPQAQ